MTFFVILSSEKIGFLMSLSLKVLSQWYQGFLGIDKKMHVRQEIIKEKNILGIICVVLISGSLLIISVSGFVSVPFSNNIEINLNTGVLGNINEGQRMFYTPKNISSLDNIVRIISKQANISLFFDTDLDSQRENYAVYQIIVKVGDNVPLESNLNSGDTITVLDLKNPDTEFGIKLDTAGSWTFDFEILTVANSVSSDKSNSVNIRALVKTAS